MRRKRVEVVNERQAIIHFEAIYKNATLCGMDLHMEQARATTETVDCMSCLVHDSQR